MRSFLLLSFLLPLASAHSTWQELWVNGVDLAGSCLRTPPSNSPVTDVSSTDLRCNVGGTKGVSGVCSVPAGATVTLELHQQPGNRSCSYDAIDPGHIGPIMVYMSKVSDATTSTGDGDWFKIYEDALYADGTWAVVKLVANCGKLVVTIPASLAPGDYLLRPELIGLHVASSVGGAQLYMSCFQIRVTGSGTCVPSAGLAKFPGAYTATETALLTNIWWPLPTLYPMPGPEPLQTCGNTVVKPTGSLAITYTVSTGAAAGATSSTRAATSSSSVRTTMATSATTTTTRPTSSSSTRATSTSSVRTTTTTASGATQTQWGQCGGTGWTGPMACASPYVCTSYSTSYSQCV